MVPKDNSFSKTLKIIPKKCCMQYESNTVVMRQHETHKTKRQKDISIHN